MIGAALAGFGVGSAAPGRATLPRGVRATLMAASPRDIYLAPDDRLDAASGRFVIETFGGEEVPVIGDGTAGMPRRAASLTSSVISQAPSRRL